MRVQNSASSAIPAATSSARRDMPELGDSVLGVALIAHIGRGNVASVWTGLDGEDPVAVKLLDSSIPSGSPAHRAFQRGAQAMVRLSERADPPARWLLRARRVDEEGRVLVTDLLESTALDLCALEWPARNLVSFFEQVCRAIELAHRAGVNHRCIKPSNVLVSPDLEPLVGDFDLVDLATLAQSAPRDAGGYAAYAAPEALLGDRGASPSADIYGLGRFLHFLLLGADPPASRHEVPELGDLLHQPPGLVRIIRKCTLRDPRDRYPDVSALLSDLARYERPEEVGLAGIETHGPISARGGGPASVRGGGHASVRGESAPMSQRAPLPSRGDAEPMSQRMPTAQRAPLPPAAAAATLDGPVPRRGGANAGASVEAPRSWLTRRAELGGAAAGAVLLAGIGLAIALAPLPPSGLLHAVRVGSALGAALLTFALPRPGLRLQAVRLATAAVAAGAVFLVDASQLSLLRLRATLAAREPGARSEAVRRLVRAGSRRFDGADLSGLDLSGQDLSLCSLFGANLSGADLSGAALMESSFDGADLTGAIVRGADLSESNAASARGWESVECDAFTRPPPGWVCLGGRPARKHTPAEPPGR